MTHTHDQRPGSAWISMCSIVPEPAFQPNPTSGLMVIIQCGHGPWRSPSCTTESRVMSWIGYCHTSVDPRRLTQVQNHRKNFYFLFHFWDLFICLVSFVFCVSIVCNVLFVLLLCMCFLFFHPIRFLHQYSETCIILLCPLTLDLSPLTLVLLSFDLGPLSFDLGPNRLFIYFSIFPLLSFKFSHLNYVSNFYSIVFLSLFL